LAEQGYHVMRIPGGAGSQSKVPFDIPTAETATSSCGRLHRPRGVRSISLTQSSQKFGPD
jgi:hypothetical protein